MVKSIKALCHHFFNFLKWNPQFLHFVSKGIGIHAKKFTCTSLAMDFAIRFFENSVNMPLDERIEFQRFIFGPTGIGVYLF